MASSDSIHGVYDASDVVRSCLTKKGYDTIDHAENDAKNLNRIHRTPNRWKVYLCGNCEKYHVGRMSREQKKVLRNERRKKARGKK